MATGTVKWFNSSKGCGYIQQDDGGADVFVHYLNQQRCDDIKNLNEGDKVTFDVIADPRGPLAIHVRKV